MTYETENGIAKALQRITDFVLARNQAGDDALVNYGNLCAEMLTAAFVHEIDCPELVTIANELADLDAGANVPGPLRDAIARLNEVILESNVTA